MCAGNTGQPGIKIAGRDNDYAAGPQIASAERQCAVRVHEVFDDVEKDDDVHHADFLEIPFIRRSGEDIQAGTPRILGGVFSPFVVVYPFLAGVTVFVLLALRLGYDNHRLARG